MSEYYKYQGLEASEPIQQKVIEAVGLMPKSGIALRGDQLFRARVLSEKGLVESQINYIVITPPEIRPKVWSKETGGFLRQINGAVEMALIYGDPWYPRGIRDIIPDDDFVNFEDYFSSNQEKRPAITWFTEESEGQFDKVVKLGNVWADYDLRYKAGTVGEFGQISSRKIGSILNFEREDIKLAQEKVLSAVRLSESQQKQTLLHRLFSSSKKESDTNILRRKRREFRIELGRIGTEKLIDQMIEFFGS